MTYPTLESNAQDWVSGMTALLGNIADGIADDMLDAAVMIVEPALETIADTAPPRGDNEFVWSNDAVKNANARRYYFWAIAQGLIRTDGQHYIRQGKPPYGLDVQVDVDSDGAFIAIFSTWDKFNMVFGNPLTGRGQLPGHQDTRWANVKQGIDDIFADVNVFLLDRHNDRVEAAGQQSRIGRLKR